MYSHKINSKYDFNKRDLPPIPPNTTVRIHSKDKREKWKRKGKVLSKRDEPRSYDVINENGNVVRRNRYQLIPTNEKFEVEFDYDTLEQDNPIDKEPGESEVETQVEVEPSVSNEYHTRSGRLSKKPDRYGY